MNLPTTNINGYPFVYLNHEHKTEHEMLQKSKSFYDELKKRRSVREYASTPIPRDVVENILRTASTAPSGAHKQPWHFCLVGSPEIKKQIRIEAEKEEYESYQSRMSEDWKNDLLALQTDWHKPFLEIAPYLIIVFKQVYEQKNNTEKRNNYYVNESVGIACGILLAAIHHAGLVALTHTPSPMNFLSKILGRPENERPYLLIPIGYPAENTLVPDLERKELSEIMTYY
jgi:iodotyrosine deiodinase